MTKLIIGRKIGEAVRIGDDVFVTILKQSGKKITVQIEAPREIRIERVERIRADGGGCDGTTRAGLGLQSEGDPEQPSPVSNDKIGAPSTP